ncbi:MAG TPA: aldehyde dehydrogenase family protein [Baekduia sp.]|jgi:acyl-CoA reductase-like NAD-dependent aldehyde dehydrogenase
MAIRVAVAKTYKLYVGGAFVRSESGRHDPVSGADGEHVANVPRGSRKDVRDAVKVARKAQAGWGKRTAYNRGQVLYRAAEAVESRAGELAAQAVAVRGVSLAEAEADVGAAVDALVHYAGWTDKLHAVLGTINPVAAPFLSMSTPEPTGVVAVLSGPEDRLASLVASIAAPLAAGNTVVVALPERAPLAGLDLGEILGVSDVPGGVVNLLSGRSSELVAALAAHHDVNAVLDLTGDPEVAVQVDTFASETLKRVVRGEQSPLARLEALTELRTVWHPVGA